MDGLVTDEETDVLLALAKKGLSRGGGSGGASILDLHSGALSKASPPTLFGLNELARKKICGQASIKGQPKPLFCGLDDRTNHQGLAVDSEPCFRHSPSCSISHQM